MVDIAMISGTAVQVMYFVIGLAFITILAIFGLKKFIDWKRYNHQVFYFEQDGFGQPNIGRDVGGIYIHPKTKNKRFFLKNNNVGIDPRYVPYVKNQWNQKIVFLVKDGSKNFRYLSMESLFAEGQRRITVSEEDVNWAINDYQSAKATFGTSLIEKMIPYLGVLFMGVIILALVAIVMQKFDVLSEVAIAFKDAANAYSQMQGGTTVIS